MNQDRDNLSGQEEILKRYFADEGDPDYQAMRHEMMMQRVAKGMAVPIRRGERYLEQASDGSWRENVWGEELTINGLWHPNMIRLPNYFQGEEWKR